MVMSLDGSTVVQGNSRALSGDADRSILVGLRSLADVIVVGSSTVRIDDYGPPSRKDLRVGVVSRTGNIDLTTPLFTSGAGFLIIPEDAPEPSNPSVTCIRAGHGSVDFAAAMCHLDGTFIQLEGGPGLNASMAQADLIDEINLTISPNVAANNEPRLLSEASPILKRFTLLHILEEDGFLFLRYARNKI
jgi:riboflavin biosynthesis pyrimidine reductase